MHERFKKLFPLAIGIAIVGLFLVWAPPVFAQEFDNAIDETAFETFAEQAGFGGAADIRVIIARLIRTALTFAGVVLFAYVVYGGVLWMTSQGEVDKIAKAKRTLLNAIIGVVIILSSWAITTFVINSLVGAVTGGGGGDDPGDICPPYCGDDDNPYYDDLVAESYGCLEGLDEPLMNMNVVVTVLFNQDVDEDTVEANFKIYKDGVDEVSGTYDVGDESVSFTPEALCDGYVDEYCLEPDQFYTVELGVGLDSVDGDGIDCDQGSGCYIEFTTGNLVDTDDPEAIMVYPNDGQNIEVNYPTDLQALANDDGGLNRVSFYLDDSFEDSGVELDAENDPGLYTGLWDNPELGDHEIYARAYDCAGNRGESDPIDVEVLVAHCFNGEQDEDEEGVDCGGADCDACDGESCVDDGDCEGGICENGVCVGYPAITSVSPGAGVDGNYVSIAGTNFGDDIGTIYFLGTDTDGDGEAEGDDDDQEAPMTSCDDPWTSTLVLVEVPTDAEGGPIKLITAPTENAPEGMSDRTDDLDRGTLISDFVIDEVVRPGLCPLDPDQGLPAITVQAAGKNFGVDEAALYFLYGPQTYEPTVYYQREDTLIEFRVPPLSAGEYDVQVFVDGEGSNEVTFETLSVSEDEDPIINYVDSGRLACTDNVNLACIEDDDCTDVCDLLSMPPVCENDPLTSCTQNADCEFGACDDAGDTGPIGQYVTIFGSGFGDDVGLVYFRHDLDDLDADTVFPAICEDNNWTDTSVTVKVPTDAVTGDLHYIWLQRGGDYAVSNEVEFDVLDGMPGPSICAINPESGPEGTDVEMYGEDFGYATGTVEFWEDQEVSPTVWNDDQVDATVPNEAVTGRVYVFADGERSNPTNFTVADCNEEPDVCAQDAVCCEDGTCDDSAPYCEDASVSSEYVWHFSTGEIPPAPELITECVQTPDVVISPTPYYVWEGGEEACVNSRIQASFVNTVEVWMGSINANTVFVQACADSLCEDDYLEDPVAGTFDTSVQNTFFFDADEFYEVDTWYQVTLLGAGNDESVQSVDYVPLERDYAWTFQTRAEAEECEIEDVYVTPSEIVTLTEIGDDEVFGASPVGPYECQLLIDNDNNWVWELFYGGVADVYSLVDFLANLPQEYNATVQAVAETEQDHNILVQASILEEGVSDHGELIVDFDEPSIVGWEPDCDQACVNSEIFIVFSNRLEGSSIEGNYDVYKCTDAACLVGLTQETNMAFVYNVVDDHGEMTLVNNDGDWDGGSFYRVIIRGDDPLTIGIVEGMQSYSGVGLNVTGELSYGNDASWIFGTKEDTTPCGIERVEVSPEQAIMSHVGERQVFQSSAYGAPDECSVSGQRLTANSYPWSWEIADVETIVNGVPTAYTIAEFNPALINTTLDLPDGCTTQCLHTGSEPGVPVCGNGVVEYWFDDSDLGGEDCDDGNTMSGDGCSYVCLNEGSTVIGATCGDGVIDVDGEECEDGALCGDGSTSCTVGAGNCNALGPGLCEDETTVCLDDADCVGIDNEICVGANPEYRVCASVSNDGCSSECLREGSETGNTTCGDGFVNVDQLTGVGEECDDGNALSGDGCSSVCLNEGSQDDDAVFAVCGNGVVEDGEDCDDSNYDNGDGCSENCLNEGYSPSLGNDCGDGSVDFAEGVGGEDCDDGNTEDGDGCSSDCLLEGSSYLYDNPSFCGDAELEDETGGEECEASAGDLAGDEVGPYDPWQLVEIAVDAPEAVEVTGENPLMTDLTATGEDDYANTEIGTASVGLYCSCDTDLSCGANTEYIGCGLGGCCFVRSRVIFEPDDDPEICRNALLSMQFDQTMDQNSMDDNIILVYLGPDADGDFVADEALLECPDGYVDYPPPEPTTKLDGPWYAKAWQWVKQKVMRVFGHDALAVDLEACVLEGSLQVSEIAEVGSEVVYFYGQALEANGLYQLVIATDVDPYEDENYTAVYNIGVLSSTLVTMVGDGGAQYGFDNTQYAQFVTGTDICELDLVEVQDLDEDNPGIFLEAGEVHAIQAQALNVNGVYVEAIQELPGVYEWDWDWITEIDDEDDDNVLDHVETGDEHIVDLITQDPAIEGEESVIAMATITVDTLFESEGEVTTGSYEEIVLLCENPWPAVGHFPFKDTEEGDADFELAVSENDDVSGDFGPSIHEDDPLLLNCGDTVCDIGAGESLSSCPSDCTAYSNFSFYYCRDAGEQNNTEDDLPALSVIEAPNPPVDGVFREILFTVQGEGYSDAIGVRLASNENYYSPEDWFYSQEFSGGTSEEGLDDYDGVRVDRTLYVSAANQVSDIYPNIYAIAYSENANEETVEIYDQVLDNWSFNANTMEIGDEEVDVIPDIELCYEVNNDGTLSGPLVVDDVAIACEHDATCKALDAESICADNKAKLQRDLGRLTDFRTMMSLLESYGEENRHCSVTKGESCSVDENCPDGEECVDTVPELDVGTFLRSRSYSVWPSWQAQFANALGTALPTDPLNNLVDCPEGYDADSCWNSVSSEFTCNEYSHTYSYRSIGGEEYELSGDLEYDAAPWAYAIDDDVDNYPTISLGHAAEEEDGFEVDWNCAGDVLGISADCGDGVIGDGEDCEVGDTETVDCDDGDVYICFNDSEPSYNGDTCDEDADCGNGGTCANGYTDDGDPCTYGVADCNPVEGVKTVTCCDDNEDTCPLGNPGPEACERSQLPEESPSACVPYTCGNGVVDGITEICDDGALNGVYGYCGADCTYEGAIYCGDGSIAGGEVCDCGYDGNHQPGTCGYWNGLYSVDPSQGCAFDCSGNPPHCGDAIVNDNEECDTETETYTGKICDSNAGIQALLPCETDSDCNDNGVGTCGTEALNDECGRSTVCVDGERQGMPCANNVECGADINLNWYTCSTLEYDLIRTRSCRDLDNIFGQDYACTWGYWNWIRNGNDWHTCLTSTYCGNGEVDGNEECDDGNEVNTDECTNACLVNVCGDGYEYVGEESCDFGVDNGTPCEAPYDGSCQYCTVDCQYQTVSGGYCGDLELSGSEFCDGDDNISSYCYDSGSPGSRDIGEPCDDDSDCESGFNCYGLEQDDVNRAYQVGYCNGGFRGGINDYEYNGEPCLVGFDNQSYDCGEGDEAGVCEPMQCAQDCGSSCPVTLESGAVLIEPEGNNPSPATSANLYAYGSGESPDSGSLHFPSCRMASQLFADVSFENREDPYTDIIFVTELAHTMYAPLDDGEHRFEVAKDIISDAITELFSTFEAGKLRVGLISFAGLEDLGATANTSIDQSLTDDMYDLLAEIDTYAVDPGDTGLYAATADGISRARNHFDDETRQRIIVLVNNGLPALNQDDENDSESARDDAVDQRNMAVNHGITMFSLVTADEYDTQNIGMSAHLSSEECDNVDYNDRDECTSPTGVPYAYHASTQDESEIAFDEIINTIRGVTITYTTELYDDDPVLSGGVVLEGFGVALPFPAYFECLDEDEDLAVPVRIDFGGEGTIEISDIQTNYCPYQYG